MWSRKDIQVQRCEEVIETCQDLLKTCRSRIRAQQSRLSLLEHQMRQVRIFISKYDLGAVEAVQEEVEEEAPENHNLSRLNSLPMHRGM